MGERRAVALLLGIAVNCTMAAIALVILQDTLLTVVVAGTTLGALIAFASQLVVVKEQAAGTELVPVVTADVDPVEVRDAQVV